MIGDIPRRITARRGCSLSYRGKTLLSTIDPITQAERLVDAVSKLNRTLYFCVSPLFGYGLEKLLDSISADSAVLCVETDEELARLAEEALTPLLNATDRLCFTRSADPVHLCALVRSCWGSRRFRRIAMLRLSGGWQFDVKTYDALAEVLRREIAADWGNAITLAKLGRRYISNTLRNLPLLAGAEGIEKLNFGTRPILVLGAGPSLDGVLDGLEAKFPARRPFIIVAVDTALGSLKARGIKPDLVVALESQHWNLRDFIGLGDWELPLAMDLSALPATGGLKGGKPYIFFTPWAPLRLFDRLEATGLLPEKIPPLGSVGLSTVFLSLRLGSGPVIIAGIDFSFTVDLFHARSSPSHREKLRLQSRLRPLISGAAAFRKGAGRGLSKSGGTVLTDISLKNYRDLFEREFAPQGGRLRDIAGSGLKLGVETLSLENALGLLETGGGGGAQNSITEPGEKTEAGEGQKPPLPDARPLLPARPLLTARALSAFILKEQEALEELRAMLTGEKVPEAGQTEAQFGERLETLLDECDYLWAHFPDCAGTEGRRPGIEDLSFLKRVRVEIDPFLKLWNLARKNLDTPTRSWS
ncbi:MAG: DUF115 domain-containing protein [Treponema sp.]|jgi:hypothetical protein|nr:DUF115 domain-containing protein [Treponema sp.]